MKNKIISSNEPTISIGTASKLLGLSTSTLRMYENEGLMVIYKTPKNRRLYSPKDLEWAEQIQRLIKKEKMNIAGIKHLLALIPCWKIKRCSEEPKSKCKAYFSSDLPCWVIKTAKNPNQKRRCRNCEIYLNAQICDNLKLLLKQYPLKETPQIH
jgi:MerR family transcriptional regulator/heat shock protein HspR